LITGSTRNTGRSTAAYFGSRGYTVAINGRSADAVAETVAELTADGIAAVPAVADVSDPAAVQEVVAHLESQVGDVVAMIHNATLRRHDRVVDTSFADWAAVLGTVLTGGFVCAKCVLPAMIARGTGRLVFIGGHSAQSGVARGAATGAAKNGLFGLTKALAKELGPNGITVNCISPGVIETVRAEVQDGAGRSMAEVEANRRRAVDRVPVGRLGRQDEVAAMAFFLCSDEAAYVTGQIIGVNGGIYL
jgi:3-oxoacyl-[acyl-carrier protein] reductase